MTTQYFRHKTPSRCLKERESFYSHPSSKTRLNFLSFYNHLAMHHIHIQQCKKKLKNQKWYIPRYIHISHYNTKKLSRIQKKIPHITKESYEQNRATYIQFTEPLKTPETCNTKQKSFFFPYKQRNFTRKIKTLYLTVGVCRV